MRLLARDSVLFDRDDADLSPVLTVILEADLPVDLRVKGMVLPKAHVEAGIESATLLAHQNRSARHDVPVVALDAQALRIAVAAVS